MVRDGIADVAWFDQHGNAMTPLAWDEPEARTLTMRRAISRVTGGIEMTLILFNGDSSEQGFILPGPEAAWMLLARSTMPMEPEAQWKESRASLEPHSVMVLTARIP
jgi:glycogen operon protein